MSDIKLETRCPHCKIMIDFTGGRFREDLMDNTQPTYYKCGACDMNFKIYSNISVILLAKKDH